VHKVDLLRAVRERVSTPGVVRALRDHASQLNKITRIVVTKKT
jgi:hypothetical protein